MQMSDSSTQTNPNDFYPSQVPKVQSQQHFTKIVDNLYLTSASDLTDDNLEKYQVTHIVNATRTIPLKRNYRCLRVNILDSAYENISNYFDTVADFINEALVSNGTIVVHCISGISRSSSLVIAFLMKYNGMNLKNAFDLVHSKRWFIRPNTGFFKQLCDYEHQLFGENSVKMVRCDLTGTIVPDFILEDQTNYKYFYLCIRK